MKLYFKFGYIHTIKWLIIFREQNYTGSIWNIIADDYNKYWKNMLNEDLTLSMGEHIINTLRKL